jgi:translocation and assembly module TamB
LRALQADLSGTLANFRLQTQGQATIASRAIDWQAQVSGGQSETGHWQGRLNQLQIRTPDTQRSGSWLLQAVSTDRQPILLDWLTSSASQTFTVSAGSAKLHDPHASVANIDWQPAQWSAPRALSTQPSSAKAQWQSQGQITDLPLTWLVPLGKKSLADLGLSSDLILSGNWDAKQSDSVHLSAMLERSSGDLRLSTEAQAGRTVALPANMQEARLNVNLDGDRVSGSLRWDSERVGRALMAFSTQLQATDQGWTLPANAPVGASLQMQMPPLDAWSVLAPPGWRLRGTMTSDISLTGTLDKPEWSGSLQARDLAVRSVVDGIDFNHGSLNARLHGQQLDINNFSLQGASTSTGTQGGQVDLQGSVKWLADSAAPQWASRLSMALDVQAKALRLSSRSDRRVTVSGKLDAQLKDARLTLRGTLTADQALITLPDDDAPRLGDDVVVRRAGNAATPMPPAARPNPDKTTSTTLRIVPDVLLNLDLGPDFQVRGRGLDTRLTGKLELRALDQNTPTLIGTIRTQRGTYRAYGQRLDIEQGVLRFVGPVDNPALNILAIRPKLSQKVGVQILGSAQSPIVRLYADPEMSEADKLAWLVLGRSASDSGGESALLQQAALALLGGSGQGPSASLTQALGLDELSFRSATGETTSGATVTLGKRLSNDFYVAYESGLAGSMGVFTIFYDLSKTLTLRAQTGEQSTVDLIWTYRYD